MGGARSTYVGEVHIGFWWGNLWEQDHLENPSVNWRIILKWIFRKWDRARTGLIRFRIRTGDGLL